MRVSVLVAHTHRLQSDEEEVKVELKHHQPKPKPPPERKGKRASLADAIGEWPTLHKVTKKKKVAAVTQSVTPPPLTFSVCWVAHPSHTQTTANDAYYTPTIVCVTCVSPNPSISRTTTTAVYHCDVTVIS